MLLKRSLSAIISVAATVTTLAFALPANATTAPSNPHPTPPKLAPGTPAASPRALGTPGPAKLPPGVKRIGWVLPGTNITKSAEPTLAGIPAATEDGPYEIAPYTSLTLQ
jgi:hypothetical protein